MSEKLDAIFATKEKLSSVSCSFCLAKWLQVTIHLQNGHTHSCHHPDTHQVPLTELAINPSALHNTNFKKLQRKDMLEGRRPKECDYCWNIEDTPGSHMSDRYIKSNDHWAMPNFENVKGLPWENNINPTYVEVSFSSTCNFKCSYCAPHISTKWMEEVRKYGPYPTLDRHNNLENLELNKKMPIPPGQTNPYVEAFWKWWPEFYKNLKVFRITGGEPLLAKDTFEVLDFLNLNPNPDLDLAINSNLGVPFKLIEKFTDSVEQITKSQKVKSFSLFTSIDTYGAQAEYIRTGLDYNYFIKNIDYVLSRLPNIQIIIMCTFNALSVVGFKPLLDEVVRIRKKYSGPDRKCGSPLILDISYLRHPSFMSAKILPDEFVEIQEDNLSYMKSLDERALGPHVGFYDFEIAKMSRLLDWMKSPKDSKLSFNQINFFKYFSEYDKRRNTQFLQTFPTMKSFWKSCEELAIWNQMASDAEASNLQK